MSPKNIVTAVSVKKIAKEDDRSQEVVVFGVDEETGERPTTTSQVAGILEQFDEKLRSQSSRDAEGMVSVLLVQRIRLFSV